MMELAAVIALGTLSFVTVVAANQARFGATVWAWEVYVHVLFLEKAFG
jgi:hypothetical protein